MDSNPKYVAISCEARNISDFQITLSHYIKICFDVNLNVLHLIDFIERLKNLIAENKISEILEEKTSTERNKAMERYLELSEGNLKIARNIYLDRYGLEDYKHFFEKKK